MEIGTVTVGLEIEPSMEEAIRAIVRDEIAKANPPINPTFNYYNPRTRPAIGSHPDDAL